MSLQADIVIVGSTNYPPTLVDIICLSLVDSHLITLFDQGGIPAVSKFLRECREILE